MRQYLKPVKTYLLKNMWLQAVCFGIAGIFLFKKTKKKTSDDHSEQENTDEPFQCMDADLCPVCNQPMSDACETVIWQLVDLESRPRT